VELSALSTYLIFIFFYYTHILHQARVLNGSGGIQFMDLAPCCHYQATVTSVTSRNASSHSEDDPGDDELTT